MKNKNDSTLKTLYTYVKPYKWLVAAAVILSVISVAGTLLAPVLVGNGIDFLISRGNVDMKKLFSVLVKIVVIVAFTSAVQWMFSLCTNKISYKIISAIRNRAFEKICKMPLSYIDSHPHGDMISRVIADVEQISDGLLMGFAQLFTGVCTIFGTL